jgi:hypothetical protein
MNKQLSHGEKIRLNGIRKFGSEEAWRKAQAENGKRGGLVRVPKGFAVTGQPKRNK